MIQQSILQALFGKGPGAQDAALPQISAETSDIKQDFFTVMVAQQELEEELLGAGSGLAALVPETTAPLPNGKVLPDGGKALPVTAMLADEAQSLANAGPAALPTLAKLPAMPGFREIPLLPAQITALFAAKVEPARSEHTASAPAIVSKKAAAAEPIQAAPPPASGKAAVDGLMRAGDFQMVVTKAPDFTNAMGDKTQALRLTAPATPTSAQVVAPAPLQTPLQPLVQVLAQAVIAGSPANPAQPATPVQAANLLQASAPAPLAPPSQTAAPLPLQPAAIAPSAAPPQPTVQAQADSAVKPVPAATAQSLLSIYGNRAGKAEKAEASGKPATALTAPGTAAPAPSPFAIAAAPAPAASAVPAATPAPVNPAPQTIETLVERLAQARETAQPGTARLSVANSDFGTVSLRFETGGSGLSVSMTNADPEFAATARTALAERAMVAGEHVRNEPLAARSDPSGQQAASNQSQTQSQQQSQAQSQVQGQMQLNSGTGQDRSQGSAPQSGRAADERAAANPADADAPAATSRRAASGLYI